MKESVLIELGLSQNEAKTYLALLESGPTTIGKIADSSKIHRTNVYDSIKKLTARGLVSTVIRNEERIYQAAEPDSLSNILKEKELKLLGILPQLALTHSLGKDGKRENEVCLFCGLKAARNAMDNMLSLKKPIYVFGISHNAPKLAGPFLTNFHRRRVEQKVEFWHIYNSDCAERAKFFKSMTHTHVRHLPKEYDVPVATNICGDELWMILWEEDAVVIQIKNKRISEAYKKYFDVLWSIAKEFE